MKFRWALLAIAGIIGTPATWATPEKAQQLVQQVCAACHGVDGNSPAPMNPNLAGQHREYLAKQLTDFKANNNHPAARQSAVMNGIAATLSSEDIKSLSAYFAEKTPKPREAKNPNLVKTGEKIYRGGNAQSGLPACMSCHSPTGAGIPAQYPRLAGQHADYTIGQLTQFKQAARTNDPNKTMQSIALKMSDQEIKAVAEYIAGLR